MKNISKKFYQNSINIIIDDLEESFKYLESIKLFDYKSNVKNKYEKKINEIKETISKIFNINYEDIINYLKKDKNWLLKKMYNSVNNSIYLIESLKDEIYMDKEIENLKKWNKLYKNKT